MRKLFTFLLSVLFVSTLFAQKPTANIAKADVAPVIGGDIDAVWDEAEENAILLPFKLETPTLGSDGETWWKGLWVDGEGIYILVNVTDNNYYPYYMAQDEAGATVGHMYDQIELYFDVNIEQIDGGGGRPEGLNGHYQIGPGVPRTDDGTLMTNFREGVPGITFSYNADDAPNFWGEFFIPFTWLIDENGEMVNIEAGIGFDVTVIDGDRPGGDEDRQRAVWANDGNTHGLDESWNNMDAAGIIYLEDALTRYINEIHLTGGDITQNGETLQIGIELVSNDPPNPPSNKTVKWVISEESTAEALISAGGLVTPLTNGTLIVTAMDPEEYVESNEITINITGQVFTVHKASYIIDGYFDNPDEDGHPGSHWPNGDGLNDHTAYVEEGVFYFSPDTTLASPWNMKVRQAIDVDRLAEAAGEEFLIGFKMWATEEVAFQLVLEQQSDSWNHWGTGGTATSQFDNAVPVAEGNSRWNLTVTTEPTWFKLSFVANNLDGNRADFGFQPGTIGDMIVGLDSLYLIEAADSARVDWEWTSSEKAKIAGATLNVYPNPATDKLNVTISDAGSKSRIAIYNSVGLKMEEIEVVGNRHEFDVSNYPSGLYFVRSNDKVAKFVR